MSESTSTDRGYFLLALLAELRATRFSGHSLQFQKTVEKVMSDTVLQLDAFRKTL